MENFEGRTALITGSGSGMGRSIALTLASVGVDVVIADIESDSAERVRDEAVALGVEGIAVATDVSELTDVVSLAEAAYQRFGKVDILVNHAGVTLRPQRAAWDTSYEDFRWVIGVNFWGVLHGHHVFVPRMLEQPGDKHIVNTSTMGTLKDHPGGNAAYVASKSAVEGLSLAAAPELATQNIGITILHPGPVDTRIATSERLRPERERSETRGVKAWSSYVGAGTDDPVYAGFAEAPPWPRIDPDLVGPMVVDAIRENRLFCLTHPALEDDMRARLEAVVAGYQPITSDTTRSLR